MRLRKALAGSDSFGNIWATDGAVIDVPQEQGWTLLRIPDGGFTEVTGPEVFSEVVIDKPVVGRATPQIRPVTGRRTNIRE